MGDFKLIKKIVYRYVHLLSSLDNAFCEEITFVDMAFMEFQYVKKSFDSLKNLPTLNSTSGICQKVSVPCCEEN